MEACAAGQLNVALASSEYDLQSITIKDSENNYVELDAEYNFTMPTSAITISAVFVQATK